MEESELKQEPTEEQLPLHPRLQAVKDKLCCGHCAAHYPQHVAINIPIPPRPGTVQVPGQMEVLPMFVCGNHDSPYFQCLLTADGSCDAFVAVPEKLKKKVVGGGEKPSLIIDSA